MLQLQEREDETRFEGSAHSDGVKSFLARGRAQEHQMQKTAASTSLYDKLPPFEQEMANRDLKYLSTTYGWYS